MELLGHWGSWQVCRHLPIHERSSKGVSMDDGKGMANVVWIKDRQSHALKAAQYRSHQVESGRVGSSVLDSPFLEWVTQRPQTLERRQVSLPQRVAQQMTYLAITLAFVGVVAWAGYITGA
jgi:hypothetical protein